MVDQVTVQSDELNKLVTDIFVKNGLSVADASIVTHSLVEANLRGVDTHGVVLVDTYVKRLQAGSLNRSPYIRPLSVHQHTVVLDGDNGLGQIVGHRAMEMAIEKCLKEGIGVIAAQNSNHFGTAAYYSMMAAERGLIGVVLSNASPRLAPWGGITPIYGNNPWSIAIPTEDSFPIVLDMANSVVAFSKILTAKNKGERIPDGWALDGKGNPTTDPDQAQVLLPFGGHKGYGIAFMVEVLAGVLSGAAIGQDVGRYNSVERGQNVGHFFLVFNIENLMSKSDFMQRLGYFIKQIKGSELAAGVEKIFIPGEPEYQTKVHRQKKGIPLPKTVAETLSKMSEC